MPITFGVDHTRRLVSFRVVGPWRTEEMLMVVSQAIAQLDPGIRYDILSDHRDAAEPATAEQVRALVELLREHGRLFDGQRGAVVVGSAASYGMMRMLAAHSEQLGLSVQGFWSLDEALEFLSSDRDDQPS